MPRYIQDALGLGKCPRTTARACPPWARPLSRGIRAYAEQHNIEIEGLPEDPKAEIPPEQALHMVQTSLRSNSPGYIPPLRVRVPQAPPYSGCASVAPSRSASVRSTDDPSPSEAGVLLARSSVILVRGGHADLR